MMSWIFVRMATALSARGRWVPVPGGNASSPVHNGLPVTETVSDLSALPAPIALTAEVAGRRQLANPVRQGWNRINSDGRAIRHRVCTVRPCRGVAGSVIEREEDWMAEQNHTDRLAGGLMKQLPGSLNKPAPGTGTVRPQPQVDEKSMLETIKGFLTQSLPGTKEREKPSAPAASQAGSNVYQSSAAGEEVVAGGWEGLFRRQGQEREAMHGRHAREREEMHERHVQEMESAMGGRSGSTAVPYGHTARRSARTMGPTRMPPDR